MIKLTDRIILFTNLFDNLDKLFLRLNNLKWQLWGRDNNDLNNLLGHFAMIIEDEYVFNEIKNASVYSINKYMAELHIDSSLFRYQNEGMYLRKWNFPVNGMNAHRDYSYGENGQKESVEYTICGYLNDDYVGGLLEFPEHNISIKPPAGSVIMFPANELHLVTDLVDKHRYMWSNFIYKR